jgi:hypothetical protein
MLAPSQWPRKPTVSDSASLRLAPDRALCSPEQHQAAMDPAAVGSPADMPKFRLMGPPLQEGRAMRQQGHQTETDVGDAGSIEVRDRLEMLVTSDPVAELDHALAYAATRLRGARRTGDAGAVRCLLAWIDHRLDERLAFQCQRDPEDQWHDA